MEEVYFTADELEALDAAQEPAPVTRERQLQIIEEMGKQMGDLGKAAACLPARAGWLPCARVVIRVAHGCIPPSVAANAGMGERACICCDRLVLLRDMSATRRMTTALCSNMVQKLTVPTTWDIHPSLQRLAAEYNVVRYFPEFPELTKVLLSPRGVAALPLLASADVCGSRPCGGGVWRFGGSLVSV